MKPPMRTVICPVCAAANQRSTVWSGGTGTTCAGFTPYWDDQGVYHSHDTNRHRTRYNCSNGHVWTREWYRKCPSCAWVHAEPRIHVQLTAATGQIKS